MPTIATLPLIPLPDDASPSPNLDPSDPLNDLFGGISPPAPARPRRALTPPPLSATGSEFGDFVSVSASEDPLALTSPVPVQRPMQQSIGERVGIGKDLLDELLKHEDDPMYFHRLGAATPQPPPPRGSSPQNPPNLPKPPLTPFPSERPQHKRQASASVRAHIQRLADTPYDLSRDLSEASLTPLDTPPISAQTLSDSSISDAPREREKSHERASPPAIRRRASLSPSSPTRPSLPELSHTESQSSFIPTAATRWMDTLLSFAPPASSRQPHSEHAGTLPVPKHSTTMPIPGRAATIGRTSGFPETHTSLTHGTPFAPHAFVPATGAPGFAGDRSWDRGFEFDPDGKREGGKRSILLNGRNSMTAVILDIELADHLRPYLPALARLSTSWRLLFSLDQHGISLQTLYTRCALHKGGVVFAAKDGQGGVFGSWLGEGIHAGRGELFFGSGESFLWRAKGDAAGVDVFKWTGKNDYVALCEKDYIAFGGGDGTYGLYLDESLFDGSSAPCPTFENDVLCRPSGHRRGRTEGFQCVGVEVWGVGNP